MTHHRNRSQPAPSRRRAARACLAMAWALSLGGCAGYQDYREAQAAFGRGQSEQGMAKLHDAMVTAPDNNEYRRQYFSEREARVEAALGDAQRASELGAFDVARQALDRVRLIDPENTRAAQARARIDGEEAHWNAVQSATLLAREGKPASLDTAIARARQVLSEDANYRPASLLLRQLLRKQSEAFGRDMGISPKLRATFQTPISLSFTNASLLQVFESLKQVSGLNYMIEHDVRPDIRVTLSFSNKSVEDVLRLLLSTNQLDQRILDDNTLLIYPNTPTKQAEYKEMVVRSFYLNHADATKVATLLKTIAKARDVVVDEKLNMLVVRDSEETMRLSEKIIAMQDIAEPEVMLELEVMEVSVNRLLQMGIQWPSSISAGITGRLRRARTVDAQ